jgi:energy-coupling factor transporter ATP-binding protein EcfA2
MKIRHLKISNFRGFERLELKPSAHVFLVGQPGAGRSDLVEALWRVLSPESTRFPLSEDLDFNRRDLSRRIEIEVVLGDLGPDLEQAFLDRLEFWNLQSQRLLEELRSEEDEEELEHVLRLCYRAVWEADQQQAQHWVDFPKHSDPDADEFKRVPRILRKELPFVLVNLGGTALSLGSRGDLRRLVVDQHTDFSSSTERMMERVGELAADLVQSRDLAVVLERILEPLRIPLGLETRTATEVIRFAPEGGSLAGVLRGLQPTVKLREELGHLPLARHGSTLSGLIQGTRALAGPDADGSIILIDDFGEGVDLDGAMHLAATLRRRTGQLWLSTRIGALGQCFRSEEMVRLTVSSDGSRSAHAGQEPMTRSERIAARHLHLQILPAVTSKSIVIVEGPHDRASLTAAALKLHEEEDVPLLSAQRIAVLDAGAADHSGGHTAIPRLAQLARGLGFHVVTVIDWDRESTSAQQCLNEILATSDVVIRWPEGYAIERAIVDELDETVIRAALADVSQALAVSLDFDPSVLAGEDLAKRAAKFLKSSGGLHRSFVEALPRGCCSTLLRRCLEEIRTAAAKSGHVQL